MTTSKSIIGTYRAKRDFQLVESDNEKVVRDLDGLKLDALDETIETDENQCRDEHVVNERATVACHCIRHGHTLGMKFHEVRLPKKYRLTEEGTGLSSAFQILTGGRVSIAAQSVGLAHAAFDEAWAYAQDREQFNEPIAEIQTIRHEFADMATQIHAARLLVHEAARQEDENQDNRIAASIAKYFASEAAVDVYNEAIQIHGGYGYTRDFDVERFYRDAKVITIYEGTSEIQKEIIARSVLD